MTVTVLQSVLMIVATLLCGAGIWALSETVKTARSVRRLSDNLDAHLLPLIEKADVAVDALSVELLRVDGIVTRFEEISDRVETTSRAVQEVANAPVEIVTDLADRVRRAWKTRRHSAPEGYGPQPGAQVSAQTEPHESSVGYATDEAARQTADVRIADTEENRTAHVQ